MDALPNGPFSALYDRDVGADVSPVGRVVSLLSGIDFGHFDLSTDLCEHVSVDARCNAIPPRHVLVSAIVYYRKSWR